MLNSKIVTCIIDDVVFTVEHTKSCAKIRRNNRTLSLRGDDELRLLKDTLVRLFDDIDRSE